MRRVLSLVVCNAVLVLTLAGWYGPEAAQAAEAVTDQSVSAGQPRPQAAKTAAAAEAVAAGESATPRESATTPAAPVLALAFAPDGSAIVVASQAGVVVRNWPEQHVRQSFRCDLEFVHDVSFSADGRCVVLAGGQPGVSGQVQVVDWQTLESGPTGGQHSDVVYQVRWLSGDRRLVAASLDGTVAVLQFNSGAAGPSSDAGSDQVTAGTWRELGRFQGHARGVIGLDVLPDRQLPGETATTEEATVISASLDHTLQLWSAPQGRLLRTLSNHTGPLTAVVRRPVAAVSQPGVSEWVASAAEDRTVRFWQPAIGRMLRFARLPSVPQTLQWTRDGRALLVGCRDGRLLQVDPLTAAVTASQQVADAWITCLAVHPERDVVAVGTISGELLEANLTR